MQNSNKEEMHQLHLKLVFDHVFDEVDVFLSLSKMLDSISHAALGFVCSSGEKETKG